MRSHGEVLPLPGRGSQGGMQGFGFGSPFLGSAKVGNEGISHLGNTPRTVGRLDPEQGTGEAVSSQCGRWEGGFWGDHRRTMRFPSPPSWNCRCTAKGSHL